LGAFSSHAPILPYLPKDDKNYIPIIIAIWYYSRKESVMNMMKRLAILFLVITVLDFLASPSVTAAQSQPKTIVDADGDVVTVQLTGAGTMSVSQVAPGDSPINQIVLSGTDGSSALTIKVKKSATGNGIININSIVGNGSLKSLSAKSANLVGSGINLSGSIGKLLIGNLTNSGINLGSSNTTTGAVILGAATLNIVTGSALELNGSVGKVTATQMKDSLLWAGFFPSMSTNPMAGGVFSNGCQILSINLKGVKGATTASFINSTIAAKNIGSVKLASVETNNNGTAFGVLTDTGLKSLSIKTPKYKWNPLGMLKQTLGDFQVRLSAQMIAGPEVRVVPVADADAAVVSSNSVTLPPNTSVPGGLAIGNVIVSGGGTGFVYRVLSVTTNFNQSVTLTTETASLADALQQGSISETYQFQNDDLAYAAPGVTPFVPAMASLASKSPAAIPFGGKLELDLKNVPIQSVGATVTITDGHLKLDPSAILEAQFSWFKLQSAKAGVSLSVDAQIAAQVKITADFASKSNEVVLAKYEPKTASLIWIGGVPFLWKPILKLKAGVEFDAEIDTTMSGAISGNITLGGAWDKDDGWSSFSANTLTPTASIHINSAQGGIRVYLKPEIEIELNYIIGPGFNLSLPYLELVGQYDNNAKRYCGDFQWGVDGTFFIDFGLLSKYVPRFDLPSFDIYGPKTIWHGCIGGSIGGAPTALTVAASNVTSNSATLKGTINPNNLLTTALFEWGTTTNYGYTTTGKSLGSGSTSTNTSYTLIGLTPSTTYHYRVVASNGAGSTEGDDRSFTTQSAGGGGTAPTVETLAASNITSNSASLNATVNPNGLAASAWFEWGTTTNYGNTTLAQDVGTDIGSVSVNTGLTGLSTNTTYHFRVVASNEGGTVVGEDRVLVTESSVFVSSSIASGGYFHSLTLKMGGSVWAWGGNQYGQLGNGTFTNSSQPVQVNGLTNIISVASSESHTVALKSDGSVWAWGSNDWGQLGDGTVINRAIPIQVGGLTDIVACAAGLSHTLIVKSDGTVWGWGNNVAGQLGDGTTANTLVPVQANGIQEVIAVWANSNHTVALKSNGTVWTWGDPQSGVLGRTGDSYTPAPVSNLTGIVAVAAGDAHTMALKSDGTVWGWGGNGSGQLGIGTFSQDPQLTPVQAVGLTGIVAIAAGDYQTVALKSDGTVWECGTILLGTWNVYPIQVSGLSGVIAIGAGVNHNVAIKSDGTVWTWGLNSSGQLGNGTTNNSAVPVEVLNFP
jgi:alpha-tubulin suppressor-like RCC1 family protein